MFTILQSTKNKSKSAILTILEALTHFISSKSTQKNKKVTNQCNFFIVLMQFFQHYS